MSTTPVSCQQLQNRSSQWYLVKTVFQLSSFLIIYYLVKQINKQADLGLTDTIHQINQMNGNQLNVSETLSRLQMEYEVKREYRRSCQEWIKNILLVLVVIKSFSLVRYLTQRIALYNQCMDNMYGRSSRFGSSTVQATIPPM